jgi:hypothetical protein
MHEKHTPPPVPLFSSNRTLHKDHVDKVSVGEKMVVSLLRIGANRRRLILF